jgi:hypothetical protein
MTGEGRLAPASGADALIARLENVPFSRWHLRPRVVVGTATFFDAFDALSLAFVLPVLAPAIVGAVAATRMLETGNRRLEDIAA